MVPSLGAEFSSGVRDLLAQHRLLTTQADVDAIRATGVCVEPIEIDGRITLGSDLLTWCGDADPLHPLRSLLHSLPIRRV